MRPLPIYSTLDVHRLNPRPSVVLRDKKKVLDKIPFLCYNMVTLIEDERPINEI